MLIWQQMRGEQAASLPPRLIICGEQGRFQYSDDDGQTLTTITHSQGTARFTNVVKNSSGQLVVGVSNRVLLTSNDGETWSVLGTVPGTVELRSIAYAAGQYIAIASGSTSTTRVYRSADGVSWTAISYGAATSGAFAVPATNDRSTLSALTSNAIQVNAETNAAAAVSYGFGTTFNGTYSAFYHNGLWFGGGQGGKISTAPETAGGGVGTFTLRAGNSTNDGTMGFTYDEQLGLYVAVGPYAGGANSLIRTAAVPTSTWTTYTAAGIASGYPVAVNQGPARLIGLNTGALYTTEDWQNFTLVSGTGSAITSIYERV